MYWNLITSSKYETKPKTEGSGLAAGPGAMLSFIGSDM